MFSQQPFRSRKQGRRCAVELYSPGGVGKAKKRREAWSWPGFRFRPASRCLPDPPSPSSGTRAEAPLALGNRQYLWWWLSQASHVQKFSSSDELQSQWTVPTVVGRPDGKMACGRKQRATLARPLLGAQVNTIKAGGEGLSRVGGGSRRPTIPLSRSFCSLFTPFQRLAPAFSCPVLFRCGSSSFWDCSWRYLLLKADLRSQPHPAANHGHNTHPVPGTWSKAQQLFLVFK